MRNSWLFFAALAFAGVAHAQESPSEVTDSEIAKYKQLAFNECREPGIKRGDPAERVDAFCSCVVAALEKSMKRPEWQQAAFYRLHKNAEQEKSVLDPHLPNIKQCAAKPEAKPEAPPAQKPEAQPVQKP